MVEGADLVVVMLSSSSIYPSVALPGRVKRGLLRFKFIMSWHGGVVGGRTICFCWPGGMRA